MFLVRLTFILEVEESFALYLYFSAFWQCLTNYRVSRGQFENMSFHVKVDEAFEADSFFRQ